MLIITLIKTKIIFKTFVFQNSEASTETDNDLQKSANCSLERGLSFKICLDCQKILPFQS